MQPKGRLGPRDRGEGDANVGAWKRRFHCPVGRIFGHGAWAGGEHRQQLRLGRRKGVPGRVRRGAIQARKEAHSPGLEPRDWGLGGGVRVGVMRGGGARIG